VGSSRDVTVMAGAVLPFGAVLATLARGTVMAGWILLVALLGAVWIVFHD